MDVKFSLAEAAENGKGAELIKRINNNLGAGNLRISEILRETDWYV